MALVECRECAREVSTEAETCPNCGCPDPGDRPELGPPNHEEFGRDTRRREPLPDPPGDDPDFEGDTGGEVTKCPKCYEKFEGTPSECPECGVELQYGDSPSDNSKLGAYLGLFALGFVAICIGVPMFGEIALQSDAADGTTPGSEQPTKRTKNAPQSTRELLKQASLDSSVWKSHTNLNEGLSSVTAEDLTVVPKPLEASLQRADEVRVLVDVRIANLSI